MIYHNILIISAFVLISAAFLFLGYSIKRFTISCIVIILVYEILYHQIANHMLLWDEGILVLLGLSFYWFGLVVIRIIIERSISLHILLNPTEDPVRQIQKEINTRIFDITHYRLCKYKDNNFTLTHFGRFVSSVLSIFIRT